MSVVLSSWACQTGGWTTNDCLTTKGATFPVDITFTIYEDNAGYPGTVIDQETQTFNVPFWPSATSPTEGRWYSKNDHAYFNGYALSVQHTFSGSAQLTSQVIRTVAFNTTHYGYLPIGESAACYTSRADADTTP
jgi:hypothetical protein